MHILLAEDDFDSRTSLKSFLELLGNRVEDCPNGEIAIAMLKTRGFDLVLSDIRMPRKTGIELLAFCKQSYLNNQTPVVLFTGDGTMDSAIKALQLGAMDYVLKPFDLEQLVGIIERVENSANIKPQAPLSPSIGVFSPEMKRLFQDAKKYGTDRTIPVLIRGETGTGKELVARIIHLSGSIEARPFIDINCAAITSNLFESEMFGYEAGAFTGSLAKGQKGKFDAAEGGTLFLDEIAEIPVEQQGKLLRVLQEKEFFRVGGLRKIKTDARVICATNVCLEEAVEAGKFRRDLYYRLKVGQLLVPPLRHRNEEIVPLAKMFLLEISKQKNKSFQDIDPKAGRMLAKNKWPGNIRELRNVIEMAVFMYDDVTLRPEHLDSMDDSHIKSIESVPLFRPAEKDNLSVASQPLEKGKPLDEHLISLVEQTVKRYNGNKAAAARSLDISRSSVYRILERLKQA